jgi:hypothetical protein
MNRPRDAAEILNRDFLDTRSRILDLAAALDRLDEASTRGSDSPDRRRDQLRRDLLARIRPQLERKTRPRSALALIVRASIVVLFVFAQARSNRLEFASHTLRIRSRYP